MNLKKMALVFTLKPFYIHHLIIIQFTAYERFFAFAAIRIRNAFNLINPPASA